MDHESPNHVDMLNGQAQTEHILKHSELEFQLLNYTITQ